MCATNESGEQCLTFNDQKNSLESVVTLDELKPFIASHHHEFMASKTVTDNYPPSSVNLCSYDEIEGNIVTEEVNVPANEMHIVVASTNHQNDEECVLETENDKNKSPVFVCDLCKKNFSTARSLEIHRSLKHRNNGQCDMCPMVCIISYLHIKCSSIFNYLTSKLKNTFHSYYSSCFGMFLADTINNSPFSEFCFSPELTRALFC